MVDNQTNTEVSSKKDKKILPHHESRLVLTTADPLTGEIKINDLTDKIYKLNDNGCIEKDEHGNYITTGNYIRIEKVPKEISPGKTIDVYEASLFEKSKDGKDDKVIEKFEAKLTEHQYITTYENINLKDGKSDLETLYKEIKDMSAYPANSMCIEEFGKVIENKRAEGLQENSSLTLHFDARKEYDTKINNTQKIGFYISLVLVTAPVGILVSAVGEFLPEKKVGEYPHITMEGDVKANNEKPPVKADFNNVEIGSQMQKLLEYSMKNDPRDALDPNSRIFKKLDRLSKQQGNHFNVEEVNHIINEIVLYKKNGEFTQEEKNAVGNIAGKYAVTGSGDLKPSEAGKKAKQNTGWNLTE